MTDQAFHHPLLARRDGNTNSDIANDNNNNHDHNHDHDHDQPLDSSSTISTTHISARAGSPLLVGPEGTAAELGDDTSAEDVPLSDRDIQDTPLATTPTPVSQPEVTSSKESTTERKHEHTETTTKEEATPTSLQSETTSAAPIEITSSSTLSDITTTSSTTTNIITSSSSSTISSPSASMVKAVEGEPSPVQYSSLAYLVPVFLLIAITIGAILYRKYRARKRAQVIDRDSSDKFQSPQQPTTKKGWKQIEASDDEDGDEDDDKKVWDHESDQEDMEDSTWKNIQLQESKSRPGLIDVTYGTGRSWLKGWKSANKIASGGDGDGQGSPSQSQRGLTGPSKTVRLVTRAETTMTSTTYTSLFPGKRVNDDRESSADSDSKKGWKDSIRSLAERIVPPRQGMLERNKSPNKRRNQRPALVAPPPPPEPPAWIRPRAVSPERQVLSPPLQPHLFFSPPTSVTNLRVPMTPMTNTDSDYTYTDTDSSYPGLSVVQQAPVLPKSTAPGPALTRNPTARSTATTTPRKERTSNVDVDQTPTKNSTPTQASYRQQHPHRHQPSIDRTPTRRTRTSRTKTITAGSSMDATVGTASQFSSPTSPRKSRKERKEEKARERVNSILQASWSDRALSSPSVDTLGPPTNRPRVLGQIPGLVSPGMEQTGIDARLAKLRSIE